MWLWKLNELTKSLISLSYDMFTNYRLYPFSSSSPTTLSFFPRVQSGRVLKEGLVRKAGMKRTKGLDQDTRHFRSYVQSASARINLWVLLFGHTSIGEKFLDLFLHDNLYGPISIHWYHQVEKGDADEKGTSCSLHPVESWYPGAGEKRQRRWDHWALE